MVSNPFELSIIAEPVAGPYRDEKSEQRRAPEGALN
jgi:hypothetical protein